MISAKTLVEQARSEIAHVSPEELQTLASDPAVVIVDLRDIREIEREGRIPGSFHCPRGMLEFWIDPESPYYKPQLSDEKRLVFHCSLGWRSALAAKTAQDMGHGKVAHLEGGFEAWKSAGGTVEKKER